MRHNVTLTVMLVATGLVGVRFAFAGVLHPQVQNRITSKIFLNF